MAEQPQSEVNTRLWETDKWVPEYANRDLRPVEVMLLVRYREALGGRVLELGCGAGRLTGYLIELAAQAYGMDLSPAMVAYCERTYPRGEFRVGDMRDLSSFETGSMDAIVAGYNLLDVLDDEERGRAIDEWVRVLAGDGLLVFSSHNLASAPLREGPTHVRWGDHPMRIAADLVRMPRLVRNHRRMRRREHSEGHYAVLNDVSQQFLALHYYIGRDDQERQLREHGLELVECVDLDGRPVAAGEGAERSQELHYVVRRAG